MGKAEELLAVARKYEKGIYKKPGVTGVGVGFKYKDGIKTDEVCLVILVEKKMSIAELPAGAKIPPKILDTSTDVREHKIIL